MLIPNKRRVKRWRAEGGTGNGASEGGVGSRKGTSET